MKLTRMLFIAGVLASIAYPFASAAIDCREGFESVTFIVGRSGEVVERCVPAQALEAGAGERVGGIQGLCPVDIEAWVDMAEEWSDECAEMPPPLYETCHADDNSIIDQVSYVIAIGPVRQYAMVEVKAHWFAVEEYEVVVHMDSTTSCPFEQGDFMALDDPATARACAAILFALMENELGLECGDFPDFEP